MIQVGSYYELVVMKKDETGYYLNEAGTHMYPILLPKKEVIEPLEIGSEVRAFVYRNAKGEKVATLKTPKITLGTLAPLRVVNVNQIGAFLDWGLDKDLFMPFKQQIGAVHKGETYLVGMYEDKSGRLCATMYVYEQLSSESPYKVNDMVSGTIYSTKEAYGAFVAVDNKYHGLIPVKELYGKCTVGSSILARVKNVRPDGKLELSLRKTTHLQMEDDAKLIMDTLEAHEGFLPLNDKSTPEEIKESLEMSKAAFKRAIGRLMKEGVLEITEAGIKRSW